ncbi:glyoxalase/bleomycin resistance/extradiol dioxygenase family protein [Agromyces sp. LHK192]|uniref:VOC family protein n=1 Tax=Agromyces sp. LHK192 TaxID=2498704 RepID=UPI00196B8B46|nr:glyoxalase superfamily protein [Agromyces sp. LHK192]
MIESAFPILEVPDMERALAFYRDAFGGDVTYAFPPEGGDPVYVALAVGRSSLGIGLAESPLPPGNVLLWFYVDDVDRVTGELAAHGAEVLEDPVDQPWGERTSLVTDPFGTRIRLGAPAAGSGAAADPT